MIVTRLAVVSLLALPFDGDRPRLRTDLKTASMIGYGPERSVTLRRLIAEIEAGDVLVHVGREASLPGRLGGPGR